MRACKFCIFRVVLDDGWIYCVRNGIWVGETDSCSGFTDADGVIRFVKEGGRSDAVEEDNREV